MFVRPVTYRSSAASGAPAAAWHDLASWLALEAMRASDLVGLILVVGPSGAGKDTLISGARDALSRDPQIVFARRVVTRPPSQFEDHATLNDAQFDSAVAAGSFAFWWEAHGHRYGVAKSIDHDLRASRTVVCNTSREIVQGLRDDYANVTVVLVTAPDDVLAERLAGRRRESDSAGKSRLRSTS